MVFRVDYVRESFDLRVCNSYVERVNPTGIMAKYIVAIFVRGSTYGQHQPDIFLTWIVRGLVRWKARQRTAKHGNARAPCKMDGGREKILGRVTPP